MMGQDAVPPSELRGGQAGEADPRPRLYVTQTQIREALHQRNFRPSRLRGQNFLIDQNLMRLIADAGELSEQDIVLEVGAGTGALTLLLAERAGVVVAVEIEEVLYELAAEQLGVCDNVELLLGDALNGSGHLAKPIRDALERNLGERGAERYKVVSNLPYGIATSLIGDLLTCERPPALITVTVQREIAERIEAEPGSRDYGLLTVLVQATSEVKRVREIPRTTFWPRPVVDSALITVRLVVERRATIRDMSLLVRVTSGLFSHRRKRAANSLLMSGVCSSREQAEMLLQQGGAEPEARGDSLPVSAIVSMANVLAKANKLTEADTSR